MQRERQDKLQRDSTPAPVGAVPEMPPGQREADADGDGAGKVLCGLSELRLPGRPLWVPVRCGS